MEVDDSNDAVPQAASQADQNLGQFIVDVLVAAGHHHHNNQDESSA